MAYDPTRVESHIKDILNATTLGWGGAIEDARRSAGAISNARIQSGWEVMRAIAANPQSGNYGAFATLVTVGHNTFLPAHDGEIGIPVIVPFDGGPPMEGIPARPAQIDSYRLDPADSIYTGTSDGVRVAHDAADNGMPSPISLRYSVVNNRFKFTGFSAQVPMIQITAAMADTGIPEAFEPTIVRLSIPKLVKGGDTLALLAPQYGNWGQQDLNTIRTGAAQVPPLPAIELAQKAGMT